MIRECQIRHAVKVCVPFELLAFKPSKIMNIPPPAFKLEDDSILAIQLNNQKKTFKVNVFSFIFFWSLSILNCLWHRKKTFFLWRAMFRNPVM